MGKTKKIKNNSKETDESENNRRVLEIRTTQTAAFKQVIERISNVISDCCIVFLPPENINPSNDFYEEIDENQKKKNKSKNSGGIKILRLTEDRCIIIKLSLDAENFDYFRCDKPKITIGIDMYSFNSHMKMIKDDNPIVIYMNNDNPNTLYIRSLNENNDMSEEIDIELSLMEIANPEIPPIQIDFRNRIIISVEKFHEICKNLNNNSTYVEITSIGNEISFKGQNENGKVKMTCKDSTYNKNKKDNNEQVVQGVFDLSKLMCFSKCNKMCFEIAMYLRNNCPLILVFKIANLGKMFVIIAPKDTDT